MEAREYIETISRYYYIRLGYTFITSLDFSFIYDWYERGIPLKIVWESIIPERLQNKRYISWYIDYNVQRLYKGYLQLRVGSNQPEG